MKRYRIIGTSLASLMILGACSSAKGPGFEKPVQNDIESRSEILADKFETIRHGGVIDVDRNFLGRNEDISYNQYEIDHGVSFPSSLEQPDSFYFTTPSPATIDEIELLMQNLTDLNVVINKEGLADPNKAVLINHEGSLSRLVKSIATRFDLGWYFDGKTITFDALETRRYELPLPIVNKSINTTSSGVEAAGNSIAATSSDLELNPWNELTQSLESVISSPGKINISPHVGQIIIFAPPSQQKEAAKIIKYFDDLYSRRIALEIATFFVDTRQSANFSRDINFSLNQSIRNGNLSIGLGEEIEDTLTQAANGGIATITQSDGDRIGFSFSNLEELDAVSDYQMSNTVTQNGVIAPVVLSSTRHYVSEIRTESLGTTTTGDSSSENTTVSVSTDSVNTGVSIYALPRMLRNGKIHLSIWLTESSVVNLDRVDIGGGNQITLPDTDQRALEYTDIMHPGETLILGGYEKERASSDKSGDIGGVNGFGLNKSNTGNTERSRLIIMVRPTIIGN